MSERQIRAQLSESNFNTCKKLVNYPPSACFNDSISELIRQFKALQKQNGGSQK